ncbi:MAG TPA: hydrogenase maturation nickel metallochaperone HypA [Methanothermobacter sp.]|uniref:Hydrogenase maturation factor HypA n=1 Tax=Methanothermobacter tenebrarum TaxID=680118 RepID=A0ABN6PAG8_9EURY|nr:hydrogenase maturation nickel metallochaperone HypA [Methanothermobacter tenebrarum]MDD3453901.1 hydrogenase maturation nickel metallochaperone HypA [Methanobacteriales archaeon]MDI6882756.1 hydrogenase maturation nickel metallochaperone HypA [Methanothermobacter sp.]MDX9692612.1 hydrogenase maturation nickel metallochaperone HypA [Methanothermobacter sp.]BDH79227.1 hydrogenase maturation nickel metallochaperone HypA [Methanothermobacter tenebrarum]HHW16249.1 hydrogenase maturation nickel m
MHELSMADAIIKTVIDAAEKNNAIEVLEVTIEIGELTLLNPEQIKFILEVLSEDTILEGAKFNIEIIPARIECPCGYNGRITSNDELDHYNPIISCPSCGGGEFKIIDGRECNIKNIKIEKEE